MTFSKPSTITTIPVGSAYSYKSSLSSPSVAYIDNNFASCVDGVNGGTYSGNITLSGTTTLSGTADLSGTTNITSPSLNISSGTSTIFSAGSELTINSNPVNFTSSSSTVFTSGSAVAFHNSPTFTGTATFTGNTNIGNLNLTTGGTVVMASGANMIIQSGADLFLEGGTFVTNTATMTVQSGGTFTAASGSAVNLIGGQTILTDNSPILFGNQQSRSITQPMNVRGNATAMGFITTMGRNTFTDAAQNNSWYIPLTKLVNGANLNSVTVPFFVQGTAPSGGASNQTVTLWKTAIVGGSDTQIGSNVTIPNGLTTNSYNTTSIVFSGFSTETIDDLNYAYAIRISSTTSTQPVIWHSPYCQFIGITSLRPI